MKQNPVEKEIVEIIEPLIVDKGLALVSVSLQGQNLQIMAENPETRNLGVDECAEISREISALLDVEDPIKGNYRLEISSPGIDRPLIKEQDFADFKGFEAKIEILQPHEGQKRFRGHIKGIDENNEVLLDTDAGLINLPFDTIEKAKLVLTDELLRRNKGNKINESKA